MSESKHDLASEFPEHRARIQWLKANDGHFARLAGDYHDLVKELHRIEVGEETPADEYWEQLKKRRLKTLDDIAEMLRQTP